MNINTNAFLLVLAVLPVCLGVSTFDDLINAVEHRHRTAEQRALALFLYFICKWSNVDTLLRDSIPLQHYTLI